MEQHYINIVETSGSKPIFIGNPSRTDLDIGFVNEIIGKYKNNPSVSKVNFIHESTDVFDFPKTRTAEMN